jgi:electron transport complex protein RnfB
VTVTDNKTLADRIEDLLPQTQCTKCGYPACRPYAEAVASGEALYNQCPPGGAEGVARLAALLGKPVLALNSANGAERPRPLAVIDEQVCIGCTLCMQACPVDAIVGAPKQMHTVIAERCTGCDLCVPPCPVDCIALPPVTGAATGWDAWSQSQADAAREQHNRREARLAREREAAEARAAARRAGSGAPAAAAQTAQTIEAGATAAPAAAAVEDADAKKRAIIQAALERARKKKEELAAKGQGPLNTEQVSADVQAQIDAAEARRRRLALAAGNAGAGQSDDTSATPPPRRRRRQNRPVVQAALTAPARSLSMNANKRRAIYETLQSLNPHPTTELEYTSPFELLIAVLLSAQATDVSVNKAMRKMFPVANTPQQVFDLGEEGVTGYIKTIGLYRTKAKNVIATCRILLDQYGGGVPEDREALESLPGVGRKTANVILNTAFGHPTIAVDTHIFRVANRTGLAPGKDVRTVEAALEKFTPAEFRQDAHHWLILHGRYVCKARKPECWHCVIEPLCEFRPKTPPPDL